MPDINELIDAYEATIEDEKFSRGEKRAVSDLVDDLPWDSHNVALVRSRLFALAKSRIKDGDASKLIGWLDSALKTLPEPTAASGSSAVYFSPGESCRNALKGLLDGARESLAICVFTITDNTLSAAILGAYRRGVNVRIISDNDKAYDQGADIHKLAEMKVPVRTDVTPDHMHHKFMVVDSKVVATGSYNWTRSAARDNFENVLVTEDPGAVSSFLGEFNRLWEEMRPVGR